MVHQVSYSNVGKEEKQGIHGTSKIAAEGILIKRCVAVQNQGSVSVPYIAVTSRSSDEKFRRCGRWSSQFQVDPQTQRRKTNLYLSRHQTCKTHRLRWRKGCSCPHWVGATRYLTRPVIDICIFIVVASIGIGATGQIDVIANTIIISITAPTSRQWPRAVAYPTGIVQAYTIVDAANTIIIQVAYLTSQPFCVEFGFPSI